jgi:hypothetical protein
VAGRLTFLPSREARTVVGIWAIWSLLVVVLASAAMALPATTSNPWIAYADAPPLARWDAVWYRSIAVDGYRYDPAVPQNNVGFYPLYALAAASLARVLHTPLLATGIALSLLCLGAALLLVADLFEEWGGTGLGSLGIAALLLYPTAFFFAAFYTESLFLLLVAASLWGARRGHWLLAAVAGLLASVTRLNGFLLAPAVAVYAVAARRRAPDAPVGGPLAAVTGPLVGAAVYPAYLWFQWGDPLLYVRSKAAGWAQHPAPIWVLARRTAVDLFGHLRVPGVGGKLMLSAEVVSTVLFVVLTVAVFRRGLVAEGVFAGGTLLLLLCSGTLDGIHRYVLVLFPCFLPLTEALRRRPALAFGYAFAGVGFNMVLLHRFVHWIHVG